LNTPPLAVRNLVHPPIKIDIENVQKMVSPLFVSVATDRVEEMGDGDVSPDNRVQSPTAGSIRRL